jgi:hypothetical protein
MSVRIMISDIFNTNRFKFAKNFTRIIVLIGIAGQQPFLELGQGAGCGIGLREVWNTLDNNRQLSSQKQRGRRRLHHAI